MTRVSRSAFTLVELLLVIAIIGVLLALLVPGIRSAWALAAMTKCQINLNCFWTAQNLRRADKNQGLFTAGGAWPSMLAPYLERSADVFRCPAGPERSALQDMVTAEADPYEPVQFDSSSGGSLENSQKPPDKGFTLSDLTFRMFAKMDNLAGKNYGVGTYLGTAFLEGGYGIKKEDRGGGKVYIGIDDRMFFDDKNIGSIDYRDVQIIVTMGDQYIKSIEFVGSDQGTGGSYKNIRFEVWLGDEMLSDDFVRDIGTVIGTDNCGGNSGTTSSSGTASRSRTHVRTETLNDLAAIKSFDYGLNKGTYRVLDRWVETLDPRIILILDYGKSVANYSNKAPDLWSLYFTAPETLWMANPLNVSFLKSGETWLNYAALRHFGMANVLFCDGHIESLTAESLGETSHLWSGRAW